MENLDLLVRELVTHPNETEWLEFKHNNFDPKMIGRDISALANSATYRGRDQSYMIWGIDDKTREIIGTNYNQFSKFFNNQEIESYLRSLLSKNANFNFYDTEIDSKKIVILVIKGTTGQPVTYKKESYIRIGSYTKPLRDYSAMEAQLWDKLRLTNFETQAAKSELKKQEVFSLLDLNNYFDMQGIPIPANQDGILHYVIEDKIVLKQDNGLYSITNIGALLFAKRITDFPSVSRKAIRVIQYEDDTKLRILKEFSERKGFAVGFDGVIQFLEALLPSEEVITGTVRKTVTKYPLIALREIIANALIHQDFTIPGSSPLVEVFKNRIEITNPGTPLVDIKRIIDNPPKSRNEILSSLMRRLKLCEELGSGWDRIVLECELKQIPSPKIILYEENTRIILYSNISFNTISNEDKLWSVYLHACLQYIKGEHLTNFSLRKRFGIDEKNKAIISRLIADAISKEMIKVFDERTAPRYKSYIPIWG